MPNKFFLLLHSKKQFVKWKNTSPSFSPIEQVQRNMTSCIDITTTLEMLDLRFYILRGKVAEVAKMSLSLKLYILTNVIGAFLSLSCEPGRRVGEYGKWHQFHPIMPKL